MRALFLAGIALLLAAAPSYGQTRPPQATIAPFVEANGVRPASPIRVALTVTLPEGLHVQSDTPRDPSLIPTALTIDAPAGVRVTQLVFPHPADFAQQGQAQPLRVFEHEFVVGAELEIDRGVPAGELTIPARLRYQACDDKVCFRPITATTGWTLRVVPAGTAVTPANRDVFTRLTAGRRTGPPAARTADPVTAPAPAPPVDPRDLSKLDAFTVAGTTGGYLGTQAFLEFIHDAEQGIARKGIFEGRGPVAILVLILLGGLALNLTPCVLPMIPINL